MSTLLEIRTNVQANLPSGYHSSGLTDSKIDEFINTTQRWVCRGTIFMPNGQLVSHNFSWLKREIEGSTTDGQRRYALPDGTESGIWRFRCEQSCELIDSDGNRRPLKRRLKRDIENDRYYLDTTDTGEPKEYCIDDFDLWFYPLPDHSRNDNQAWTINLEYYGYLPDLSDDDDTNALTNGYPEVLEYGATEMAFRYGMDEEQAEYWKVKKVEVFIEMLKVDQALDFSGLEDSIQPYLGQSLGYTQPGTTYPYYMNDTPYN